jgi:Ca2+-binding RTX toxin-like protein
MSFGKVGCSLAVVLAALLWQAEASAQTASTCSFDPASATVRVTVDGQATTLSRTGPGIIRLNGVACGTATTTNTNRMIVTGGALVDSVTLTGVFAPGLTPEADGVSEIEVQLINIQNFTWALGSDDDTVAFIGSGRLDYGGDGDADVTGAVVRTIRGGAGNDLLDFSALGTSFTLDGDTGDDHLIGGNGNNTLIGNEGMDILEGGAGNDSLDGGPGDDTELGGSGNDTFRQGTVANGADTISGGPGRDRIEYRRRTVGVTVTLGAGDGDDGEPGEGDDVARDVEDAVGGSGDDTLVGSTARNTLEGLDGNDELFGGAQADLLRGGPGDDFIQGDGAADVMEGEEGNDVLVGDAAAGDRFVGGDGDDEVVGNTDGNRELVNCGAGNDVVEANDEDNFIDCEL